MPRLNYTTPLHTFSGSNTSYTATKDCYLCGSVSSSITVKINNQNMAYCGTGEHVYVSPLLITAGDVVTTSNTSGDLHVFDVIQQ